METERKEQNKIVSGIKHLLLKIAQKIAEYAIYINAEYSILGFAAAALVIAKVVTFYVLMGTSSNFIIVCIITLLFISLLFKAIKNKWIPAVIYLLLSVLMFADVTYCSFFNRYLSVGMLGAAEVVGDIGESIKEVMRPVNFTMLLDAIVIMAAIAHRASRPSKSSKKHKEDGGEESAQVYPSRSSRNAKRRNGKGSEIKRGIIALVIILLLTVNPFKLSLFKSISNQEFITFHIKDAVTVALGIESNEGNLAAWTNSYDIEKKGPLFGKAKGKNVVMIQMESLQDFVIGREYNGQEITPNLNALINGNATYFDNFYQQIGSGNTSDAEFAANNSLMGTLTSYTYKLFNENYYRGIPVLLKEQGYDTAVFHAYENKMFWSRELMYPSEGFDRYYGSLTGIGGDYEMTEWMGWGLTDSEFFPQTVEYMKELKEPYYSFIITISNHHPYEMLEHYKFIELLPEDDNTMVGHYIQSAAYTDYALGVLMAELQDAGLYDNTLFVFYGDHAGLTHNEETDDVMERILGKPYDFEEMLHVPFIIYSPDDDIELHNTISVAGGQTDILPTIAYLMGFKELDTIYTGHNLYSVTDNIVAQQTYMTKGSFFSNDVAYEMSRDGVFENGRAWNIHTGESVDVDDCYEGYLKSLEIVNTAEYTLKNDAIRKIFVEGKSRTEIGKDDDASRILPDEIAYAGYPDASLVGTNSKEALEYTVYAGYRNVRLAVKWDEDSLPYTVNNITGEVEMTFDDIVKFMESNASIYVYFDVEKSGDYLVKILGNESSAIADRVVAVVPTLEEYSGRYEAVLDASKTGNTPEEILEFAEKHKVWAVMVSAEDAAGKYSELINGEIKLYSNDENLGLITKAN